MTTYFVWINAQNTAGIDTEYTGPVAGRTLRYAPIVTFAWHMGTTYKAVVTIRESPGDTAATKYGIWSYVYKMDDGYNQIDGWLRGNGTVYHLDQVEMTKSDWDNGPKSVQESLPAGRRCVYTVRADGVKSAETVVYLPLLKPAVSLSERGNDKVRLGYRISDSAGYSILPTIPPA